MDAVAKDARDLHQETNERALPTEGFLEAQARSELDPLACQRLVFPSSGVKADDVIGQGSQANATDNDVKVDSTRTEKASYGETRLRKLLSGEPVSPDLLPASKPMCGCRPTKCCPVFCGKYGELEDVGDWYSGSVLSEGLRTPGSLSQDDDSLFSTPCCKRETPDNSKGQSGLALLANASTTAHEYLPSIPNAESTTQAIKSKLPIAPASEDVTTPFGGMSHIDLNSLDTSLNIADNIADNILNFPEATPHGEEFLSEDFLNPTAESRRDRNKLRERKRVEAINFWLQMICQQLNLDASALTNHQMLTEIVVAVRLLQEEAHRKMCDPGCPHAKQQLLSPRKHRNTEVATGVFTPLLVSEKQTQDAATRSGASERKRGRIRTEQQSTPSTKRSRRKLNPYMEYCRQHRDQVGKQYAGTNKDISQELGESWRKLTAKEKNKYRLVD